MSESKEEPVVSVPEKKDEGVGLWIVDWVKKLLEINWHNYGTRKDF